MHDAPPRTRYIMFQQEELRHAATLPNGRLPWHDRNFGPPWTATSLPQLADAVRLSTTVRSPRPAVCDASAPAGACLAGAIRPTACDGRTVGDRSGDCNVRDRRRTDAQRLAVLMPGRQAMSPFWGKLRPTAKKIAKKWRNGLKFPKDVRNFEC